MSVSTQIGGYGYKSARLFATNPTATAAVATPLATTTEPTPTTSNGVFRVDGTSVLLKFLVGHAAADGKTANILIGYWDYYASTTAGTYRWHATNLASITVTGSTYITGAATTTETFADTIAVVTMWHPSNILISPANNTPASLQLDNLDARYLWVDTDVGTATNCNVLYRSL